MIRTIYLNEIGDAVGLPGMTLATRPVGEQFYQSALEKLQGINVGDAIELSLSGLYATDTSFLDEYILGFQRLILHSYPDSIMFVSNIDTWVYENLTRLIKSWEVDGVRIPVLCFHNDKYEIIGKMEANLLETFEVCLANKEVTARQLSETKNLVLSTASTRLRKLYQFRVIYRKEVIDTFGKQYVYTLPR